MNNDFNLPSDISNPFGDVTSKEKGKKNGYAIASLVLGIVSILSCCCCCTSALGVLLMGVCAILAIVFAFIAKKNSDGKMDSKAITGLVLGLVSLAVILCFAAAIVGVFTMTDTIPQEEMLTFLDENVKPVLEGNESTYTEIVEAIKAIYTTKGAQ